MAISISGISHLATVASYAEFGGVETRCAGVGWGHMGVKKKPRNQQKYLQGQQKNLQGQKKNLGGPTEEPARHNKKKVAGSTNTTAGPTERVAIL